MADFNGTPGDDVIVGTQNNDNIYGNEGNDVLRGNTGHDWIRGNDGNDFISGDKGVDIIEAGAGNDSIFAGANDDRTDVIYGDIGNDAAAGGAGADLIIGALGRDTLFGGAGADFLMQSGIPTLANELVELIINDALNGTGIVIDIPSDFTVPEIIELLDTATNGILTNATVVELLVSNINNIIGDLVDDAVFRNNFGLGPIGDDQLTADPADFNIVADIPILADILALVEEDGGVIWGGDGEDIVLGDNGEDTMGGGKDGDVLFSLDGDDNVYGGDGSDVIYGGLGDDHLYGGAGNDWMAGGAGKDVLWNGAGNDTVGGGLGTDILIGGDGNDMLLGTDNDNPGDFDFYIFKESDGHDTIGMVERIFDGDADSKNDTFALTADADFHVWPVGAGAGTNTVDTPDSKNANTDLTVGNHPDTIDLTSFGLSSTDDLTFTLVDLDGDGTNESTKISVDGISGWSVTVVGVADIDAHHWTGIIELEPSNSVVIF
ncbi:MAG: calcium-binding protein [Rhizobiaceae bacterium]